MMKSKFFGLAAICILLLGVLIGNATTASASANVHGGNWTMVASLSGTPTYGGPNQNVTLEAGKTYQYKAWIKGAGTLALVLQKGDWSSSVVYQKITASADWQQFTATYTVPAGGAGAYHAQIQDVYQGSGPATVYIDDVFFGEATGSNLLVNGDFELGSSNTAWSVGTAPFAIVYYPSYVHGGNWTMIASLSGTPTYGGPNQNVTLEAGKTYQYKAWIKGTGTLALVLQKGDWSSSVVYQPITASADWQQFTATYTVPAGGAGAYHAQIQDIYQSSSSGTVYIDDVFFGVASGSNLLVNGDFELGSSNTAWSGAKAPFAIVNYPNYRSGLPWSSGAFKSGATLDPTKMNDFENWRGRLVDTVTDFTFRTTWSQITNSSQVAAWDGKPYRLVLGVPFFPEDGTSNFAACAAGSYNSYWNTFGTNLVSHHEGNAIIRLGWEFNGNWYNHEVTTSNLADGTWVGCFKQVVTSIRQTAPSVKIDWNVSRGDGLKAAGGGDPAQVYPGDSYVDYIGIDEYDMWEPALTQSAWDSYHMGGAYGIQHWIDFATSHGKQVSFPEWGLNHGDSHHGNDNPYFIQKIWPLFNSLSSSGKLAYEGYYDEGPGGINAALDVAGLNPNSAPVYQSNW
jgi:hypothetical protein